MNAKARMLLASASRGFSAAAPRVGSGAL